MPPDDNANATEKDFHCVQNQPKKRYPKRKPRAMGSLGDEINMLRQLMRRVLTLKDEGVSMDELLRILDMIGKSSSRLANLLRTERFLETEDPDNPNAIDLPAALNAALEQLQKDNA